MSEKKQWIRRDGCSLTLDEIHFLFSEYLNNYINDEQLETKRTIRDIEELRGWLTNAAMFGDRLD